MSFLKALLFNGATAVTTQLHRTYAEACNLPQSSCNEGTSSSSSGHEPSEMPASLSPSSSSSAGEPFVDGSSFLEQSEEFPPLINQLPCKEASGRSAPSLCVSDNSSSNEISEGPSYSGLTISEPCKVPSACSPHQDSAVEGPLHIGNEASKGYLSSLNDSCRPCEGQPSNISKSSKGPSSDNYIKFCHEDFEEPLGSNHAKAEEKGTSLRGPASRCGDTNSWEKNSVPNKGLASLIQSIPCNEASHSPLFPHNSEHPSFKKALKDPPTILKPSKGRPPHSQTKPCHKASEDLSFDVDSEAPKGFPSSSNNSCESYKAHSSNSTCQHQKALPSQRNVQPRHDTFEGPSSSMDKEASKESTSSSKFQTDLLAETTDIEEYKRAMNDTGSIGKAKKKMDAYYELIKTGSTLFSNMLWKVYFSNNFKNSFPQIDSMEKKAKIVNRIHRLSLGHHFSKYKIGCVSSTDELHGLIQVDVVADLCLVWIVDVERDVEAVQIIKIWDIVNYQVLPKLVKCLKSAFNVYSEQYIERCKFRCQRSDKELAVPERWVEDSDFVWCKLHEGSTQVAGLQDQSSQSNIANLENSSVNESLLLMKFYAMSSGIIKNLLTAKDGSEINPPFQVNKEESIIIRHHSSCFILGRSGTGKTTVLTTKLVQREQQNEISIHGLKSSEVPPEANNESSIAEEHIKQIFVTLSPLLCSEIKRQTTKIQRTLSAGIGSTNSKDYSNSDSELLLDDEIESKLMGIVPDTFVDVPSQHYPMVLTFRKFLTMLANSVPCPFLNDKTKSFYWRKEIDYDRFDAEYWPHLNAKLTKKFDSSTVFTEIMSVIKGSVQAVKSGTGVLSKELYCSLKSSTKELTVPQKEDIYNLFMQYEKLKMEANSYDMADWVKHTYKQLSCGEYQGDKIDFVYIDEVQDFTQAQLSLFSFVCRNIKEGYIFAGDTAQTITRGVHFRFQEGRSLFYTDFKESATANTYNNNIFKPELFQLKQNFRTHLGVVKLANSIVELLYHFFPQAIDKLDPETSFVWGQLPALLKGHQGDLVKAWHSMGAQQVIIVPNEVQKVQLLEKIGKSALVLTISGCKGLEFQDVLLYNFFSSSAMQNKWKVLYNYPFHTNVVKTTGNSEKKTHPTFDANKHYLLCSELKHLYVAVTRARERLWIFEDNDEFCKPMLDYWLYQDLIETKSLDQSFVLSIKSSSTSYDWRKKGLEFLKRQHYDEALLCFEQAGHEQYVKLAKAASLKQKGEKQLATNKREAIDKLGEAAELFLALKKTEKAAECYISIGDLKTAGVLYIENCTPPKFEDAGDCFLEAKSWHEAGKAYFGGGCIKKCLDACFKGKHFEEGLSFIKQWRKEHSTDQSGGYNEQTDQYLHKCAASFHQQHSVKTMMIFVNEFSCIDLKRAFLRGRHCFHELMSIEEAEGNYLQAAELAEVTGDLLHAAALLEKAGDYGNAVTKVLLLILKDALWGEQNKGWPFRRMKRPEKLLRRLKILAELAETNVRHEVQLEVWLMFVDLENPQDIKYLIAQAQNLSSTRAKFFATWKALDAMLRILKEQKLAPATNQDRNAMLLRTLSLWIDWQDIVQLCRKVVLEQDHLIPENTEDKYIREFCCEFFGVTQVQDSKVCFVNNVAASWFESHKKGTPPIEISTKEFAKLSAKFWNEKLLEKETAITEMCDLPAQLLALLWPPFRKAEEMYLIQKLRGATPVIEILHKIADQIISNPKAICTLEATGRLQLMIPFLSQTWRKKNTSKCKTKLAFWKNAVALHQKNQRVSVENFVVESGNQLINVFYSEWENIEGYISPTVFIALLERITVMACACKTLLHGMLLPMTLAVEVMCDTAQEVLYYNILSYNDLAGDTLDLLIKGIIKIAFKLLKQLTDIEEWIKHTQGDPNTDLQPLVLRLTVLLFTICLNLRDGKLKSFISRKLQKIFDYQAPELQQLPRSYTTHCNKACLAAKDKSWKSLKHAFAEALTSIGDSLIMTTRCKKMSCCQPQDGISTLELDCETNLFMRLKALASVYSFNEGQHASHRPFSFVQGCEMKSATQNVSAEANKNNTHLNHTAFPLETTITADTLYLNEREHNSQMSASFVQGCKMEAPAQNAPSDKDEYNTYMNHTAFPLKVSVEKDLHRLASAITSLENVISSLSQHKEVLEQDIQYLNPSHSKHNEYNLKWLQERVKQVKETGNAIRKLEKDVELPKARTENEESQNQGDEGSIASEDISSTNATGHTIIGHKI